MGASWTGLEDPGEAEAAMIESGREVDQGDPGRGLRPCVFFDRDGVINRSPGREAYVLRWDDFAFNPGIPEAVAAVRRCGWLAIVVTSQKGVGKGLMSRNDLDEIHGKMQAALEADHGLAFDDIYAYTGSPDDEYEAKPHPAMLHAAAAEHGLDLGRSWLVGDADRDIEMARAAGLAGTIRIVSEHPVGTEADRTLDDTSSLAELLAALIAS